MSCYSSKRKASGCDGEEEKDGRERGCHGIVNDRGTSGRTSHQVSRAASCPSGGGRTMRPGSGLLVANRLTLVSSLVGNWKNDWS